MGSNESRAKTIGAAILATAAITAAATTMVLSLRTSTPTPVIPQRSIVYVPVVLPGASPTETMTDAVGRASLTSGELAGPSASDTAEATDSEQASASDTTDEPAAPAPGYSLAAVLDGARSRLEALGAAALSSTPAPVETPATMVEAAPTAPPSSPPPAPEPVAQQAAPEPPVVGAGAFTTPPTYGASAWQSPANAGAGAFSTPGPYSASTWQSNPNAGAGQFSTDKGAIDANVGAGPFTTEWHVPTSYPY